MIAKIGRFPAKLRELQSANTMSASCPHMQLQWKLGFKLEQAKSYTVM